jgi:hypothetical protein
LSPNDLQKKLFNIENVSDIFPKYFILKVNNFNDIAKNTLDEWIYFFKNSEVKDEFKAKGLDKAKERLRYENLSEEQKKMYDRFQDNIRIENSVISTAKLEREVEIAKNAILEGASDDFIFKITGLSHSFIQKMRKELDT